MQGSLPDFLDLSPDVESPQPQQVSHKIPPFGDVLRFPASDERPVLVQEGTTAGPSTGRNPKRFGGDRAVPVPAEPPTSTRLVPRRVQSAAELASSRAMNARMVTPDRGCPKPGTTGGDLKRSDSYGRRFPTQALSTRAAAFRAEETREGYALSGYDGRTRPVAEYEGGHAYSRSTVEPTNHWPGGSHHNKRIQDSRNADIQNLRESASDANSPHKYLSRELASVVQRKRMISPQDVAGPVLSALGRPRASSAATSPLSPPRHENRYRTLGDRAYHHPDVPRTPLFSECNHDPSSLGPGGLVTKPRWPSTRRDSDIDNRHLSSPETESTFPSPRSDYSQNSSSPGSQPARARLRAPSGSRGEESYPSRESYARTHARLLGSSSPDLSRGHSLHIAIPSSSLGIGLSTTDNGAFEAPRPAPVPAHAPGSRSRAREQSHPPVAWRRKHSLRIRTGSADEGGSEKGSPVFRRPLRSLSLTRKGSNTPAPTPADPRVIRSASPGVGFGAISFRWQIWSKVQRPSERSDTPVGRLRAAGKSEPDIKTSFIETESKPPKRGLLFRKKT
ncbi:hypothetical protein EI94DRAFT_363035 [Lactarius quietus]|nr:hypothetical protein EI94DRAFT_363035 [Lactarius quietus]